MYFISCNFIFCSILNYIFFLQQPYPKGEVFIGHRDGDFSVSMGCSDNSLTQGYIFTLHTPERDFILSAETREDMNQWICALQRVTELPMTPQDNRCKYMYMWLCIYLFIGLVTNYMTI